MRVSLFLAAAALLAASLGLKLRADVLVPTDDPRAAYSALGHNFATAGYLSSVELEHRQRVTAEREGCRVVFKLLDPHGTGARAAEQQLRAEGRIAYARGGRWLRSRPRVAPLLDYFVQREFARQHLPAQRDPVWLAAIGPGCAAMPDAALTDVGVKLIPAS